MKKYIITLIVAASAVVHAQVAEPKNQVEGGEKAPAAAKLEDKSPRISP